MICTVIDIETTGFWKCDPNLTNPDYAEILEVGYIRINSDDLSILDSGTLYFYKPYFQIENKAQQAHGLTREFLQKYEKDFDLNLIKLYCLIQQTQIIGKNCDAFDIPFINAFINKHSKGYLDINSQFLLADMKDYNNKTFYYHKEFGSYDVQKIFQYTFRDWVEQKTGERPHVNRTGQLGEYMDVIPGAREEVARIYDSLPKDRVTGAHGALYDCVMTYVVAKYCVENKIGVNPE